MSRLIINENPLQVLPSLAKAIGLNESIVLQQVHYWIENNRMLNRNLHDGHYWTYNSLENWKKDQFDFFSLNTVKRIFKALENKKLLLVGNYNKSNYDRTKWYTIDYDELSKIEHKVLNNNSQNKNENNTVEKSFSSCKVPNWDNEKYQNESMKSTKMGRPIPETTRDYTEIKKNNVISSEITAYSYNNIEIKEAKKKEIKEETKIKNEKINTFFEKAWKRYPNKDNKAKVSKKQREVLYKLCDELDRCLDRYLEDKELKINGGWKSLQGGKTFFNGGYKSYLDQNYEDLLKTKELENNNKQKQQYSNTQTKPIQTTNYEQRQYDDEYFESLYDN